MEIGNYWRTLPDSRVQLSPVAGVDLEVARRPYSAVRRDERRSRAQKNR
jgi:hypothetical protein